MLDTKPQKQNYLFKHPPKRYNEDSVSSALHSKVSPQSQLRISDIRVVNDFSVDSQYFDRSSILEQSLEQDLKLWQQNCKIDQQIVAKLEKEIKEIDNQIVQLATQFDICFNLQAKAEQKFMEFQKLLKGVQFTKFSRSNCKKTAKRLIFYCPFLDAICWKSKTSKFPSAKQTIQIDQIVQIHTSYTKYKLFRKGFVMAPNMDQECFIAIEARNGNRLELLAESKSDHQLYVKTLNQLLTQDHLQSQCILEKYSADVNLIRRNLDRSKNCFMEAVERLQQNFISTTMTLLSQEKEKTQTIKKKSQHLIYHTKIQVEDLSLENQLLKKQVTELQFEKDYLDSRIEQLQEYHNQRQLQFKATNNPQTLALLQMIKDIIGLNGDQSIDNESHYDYQQTDYYQECCKALQKLKTLYECQYTREIELRKYIDQIQSEKLEQSEKHQSSSQELQDAQIYIEELESINRLLQQKLKDLNKDMESRESQFKVVIEDMQKMQEQIPSLLHNQSQSSSEYSKLKDDNERLKDVLQTKLSDLRNYILKEEKCWMQILSSFLAYLCFQFRVEEKDMQSCASQLFLKMNEKSLESAQSQIVYMFNLMKQKMQFFQKNYKEHFERQFKEQLQNYSAQYKADIKNMGAPSPLSTHNSNHDRTFSSPNKLFQQNRSLKHLLDTQQKNILSQLVK